MGKQCIDRRTYLSGYTLRRVIATRGFTILELLVVMAIMALLAAILLPSLGRARWQARHLQCQTNLYAIARAWHMYLIDTKGRFLKNYMQSENWDFNYGGKQGTSNAYKGSKPLNRYLGLPTKIKMGGEVFKCPFDVGGPSIPAATAYDRFGTSYYMNHMLVGQAMLMDRPDDPCLEVMSKVSNLIGNLDITQVSGQSRVLFVGDYGWWRAWEFGIAPDQHVDWHQKPSYHNIAFVDGHVQFVHIRKGINTDAKYTLIPFGDLQAESAQCQQEVLYP